MSRTQVFSKCLKVQMFIVTEKLIKRGRTLSRTNYMENGMEFCEILKRKSCTVNCHM